MNVIFLMDDQHNHRCLSRNGHPMVKTPNLDALAERGVYFRNFFSCSGICGPSRTSYFTGNFLRTHDQGSNNGDMRRKFPSILTELKKAGYYTFQSGKNHLPPAVADDFDEMHTMATYSRYCKDKGIQEVARTPERKTLFDSCASAIPESEQNETWTADRAIDFLKSSKAKDNKFFMWVSFQRPHAPHTPPPSYDEMYNPDDFEIDWDEYEAFENSRMQNRPMIEDFWKLGTVRTDPRPFQKAVCRYLALVTFIDAQIGRILETLRDEGLEDETLIFFGPDHGDWAGRYGQLGKNLPGYDEILHIPFIWVDPKRQGDCGREVYGLCQNTDVMPSLLERLFLEVPPTVQGQSFLPHLEGYPLEQREEVYAETAMEKTIRTRDWKLNFFVRHPERGQLFKMGAKPDEIVNYWDDPAYAHIKHDLLTRLTAWMVRCEQPQSTCPDWEAHIDTRWYRWMNEAKNGIEIEERAPKNER